MNKLLLNCLMAGIMLLGATTGYAQTATPAKSQQGSGYDRQGNRLYVGPRYVSSRTDYGSSKKTGTGFGGSIGYDHEMKGEWYYGAELNYNRPKVKNLIGGTKSESIQDWQGALRFGYTWALGQGIVTPFVGLSYDSSRVTVATGPKSKLANYLTEVQLGLRLNWELSKSLDMGLNLTGGYGLAGNVRLTGAKFFSLKDAKHKIKNGVWSVAAELPIRWHLSGAMENWDITLSPFFSESRMSYKHFSQANKTSYMGVEMQIGYMF